MTDQALAAANHRGPDTVDRLFSALANEHNRVVVRYLRDSPDAAATMDELADHVANHRTTSDASDPDRAAIHLHHVCLPKLADVGVIEYDPRTEIVRYRHHPAMEGETGLGRLLQREAMA